MKPDVDVIIIGAGPAGLSASIRLEKLGIDYLLFDRDFDPGETKPCAGFIPSSTIQNMSIPRIADQYDITSARLHFSEREPVTIQFDEPLGINVSRGALARAMISMISQSDKHHFGSEISYIKVSEDSCKVTTRTNEDEATFTSRLIIDASGANPVSQRFIKLRERISNSAMGYGLQYHIEFDYELPHSNTFLYGSQFSPSGYSWLFPRGKTMVFGTGGLVNVVRKNERKTHDYLDQILRDIEPYRSELSSGTIVKKDSALMPLAGIVRPSFGNRIMLAGDAAGHCSPISGEGIHYSMVGGLIAAETTALCIQKNDFSNRRLATYEKNWIKEMGSDLKWGYWLQRRLMRPGGSGRKPESSGTSGWSKSGFIDSEKSLRIIAQMLMGDKSVRSSILAVSPSYIKSKLSR